MFNKSIAYQLSIYISLAVITVFIAFMVVNYIFNRRLAVESIENKAISVNSEISDQVNSLVITTREVASNVANQIMYYASNDDADLLISGVMRKYPFINAIHVNIDSVASNQIYHNYFSSRDSDNILFNKKNSETYDCEIEKAVIKELIDKKTPGWTTPYRCGKNNNIIVSYYTPILLRNEKGVPQNFGEIICELSLSNLNDTINAIDKIEKDGYAFLVAQNGDFITHPNKEWILKHNLYKISEKSYNTINLNIQELLSTQGFGTTIANSEHLNFRKSWVYYSTIKETNWLLILIIPYDDLFRPLYLNVLKMLLISVLGILLVYLFITFITNRLVEPLSDVTSQLKKFSNISNEYKVDTLNEVQLVSDSLNSLKSQFEKYKESSNLEQKRNHTRMQDLIQASEIQQSLIKKEFPAFPERKDIDLFSIYRPAKVVSGDLYDYFFIDRDNLLISIGDVSGKGIPADFFMSIAQTIIKNSAGLKKPKNIVNKANKELYTNNQHQFFLTLFLGILNVKTGNFSYCNAAHTPTLILKSNGEIMELENSHGLPLGIYPDKEYSDSKTKMEKGDSLVLYTDGVTEHQDSNKFHFGIERFKENLSHLSGKKSEEMADRIEKSLQIFRGSAEQSDDVSLVILRLC